MRIIVVHGDIYRCRIGCCVRTGGKHWALLKVVGRSTKVLKCSLGSQRISWRYFWGVGWRRGLQRWVRASRRGARRRNLITMLFTSPLNIHLLPCTLDSQPLIKLESEPRPCCFHIVINDKTKNGHHIFSPTNCYLDRIQPCKRSNNSKTLKPNSSFAQCCSRKGNFTIAKIWAGIKLELVDRSTTCLPVSRRS